MDKAQWEKIREIFKHLSNQSPSFRSNYLDMVCEHDPALRGKIESMLDSHDELESNEAQIRQSENESHQQIIGKQLGSYKITSVIGKGGMSVVYLAVHAELGKVAIKSLPRYALDVSEARARLEQEARILGALSHPSLCRTYELLQTPDTFAIVMEFVDGRGLDTVLDSSRLTFSRSLGVATDIAGILSITHAQGVVHRDIKPSNVLLAEGNLTKLIDFGIAHFDKARLTYTGEMLGSPAHMAPEQWHGHSVDGRTDIWGLGALIYSMCCGQSAFQGSSIAEYAKEICNAPPRRWSCDFPESEQTEQTGQLVMRMLEKKPADRPESIDEVLDELVAIAGLTS